MANKLYAIAKGLIRQSLDAQGLRDVAAIVVADWLEVRLESLEGGR